MELGKHVMGASFGFTSFYDITDNAVTAVRIVTPRVTNYDGTVTEEVRQEVDMTVEFVCCTPERFRINVTQRNQ